MGVMRRDIAASLRRAGKVCGVAPTTVNVNVDDAIEAYEELQTRAREEQATNGTARGGIHMLHEGTILWDQSENVERPSDVTQEEQQSMQHGYYRYIIRSVRTASKGHYVTTDKNGQRAKVMEHDQAKQAVINVTGLCWNGTRRAALTQRAAVRHQGRIAVVWSAEFIDMRKTKVLIYAGGSHLISTTDEDLHTEGAWLSTNEYDKQTRTKIDELWEEAATNPMWYTLGACMRRQKQRG